MYDGAEFVDSFGSAFSASIARERPGDSSNEYKFASDDSRTQDGLLVRVRPDGGKPWRGMFAAGVGSFSGAASRIFGTPNRHELLAVSYGTGYLVDVRSPHSYTVVSHDIRHIEPVPNAGILVVANVWWFYGIGAEGIAWEQTSLYTDDIRDVVARGHFVDAIVDYPPIGDVRIRIDATTGEIVEGKEAIGHFLPMR
jgi:hypothetical protein